MKLISTLGLASALSLSGLAFQATANAAIMAGQIQPIAVYNDFNGAFGLAYDSQNNLMWYTQGDSGDSLVHSFKAYKDFTAAELALLPVVGGVKQISRSAAQESQFTTNPGGSGPFGSPGAHFASLAFDKATGQLVQQGPGTVLRAYDPITAANQVANFRPGSAVADFSDGLDVDGTNTWHSPDVGSIFKNGTLFASNSDSTKTLLPGWAGLGSPSGLGWSGVEQVDNSLFAIAVHSNADTGRSRTLVRFDLTTGDLVGFDPDGDPVAARWEDLAFDNEFLYAADLRGNANGNNIPGDVYVFKVTGGLDPNPEKVPEPASTLGLLAIGALGATSAFKRKNNQN
ncbi:PEP-CTERM sorting domain-containing protein [Limnofasciculus baicalensis]|uniref:PEP-CTERM sorting domain-containing protein n=1 Tax=Limnofasciculus baicalensis BBK-W-15 TaxID=2699891 RepID=A0AAE3KTI9_9CYAN|nr:PEP-CTERM sorting domain-containing protein [Limnofasciculus baicalensis]MCP2730577.1 PEP-CTERM sorting domain-containing protein [Limnofasciculus baicalensis BBK-W-15]